VEVKICAVHILALDGSKWSDLYSYYFTAVLKAVVDPRASLKVMAKRKVLPSYELIPGCPSPWPGTLVTELSR